MEAKVDVVIELDEGEETSLSSSIIVKGLMQFLMMSFVENLGPRGCG